MSHSVARLAQRSRGARSRSARGGVARRVGGGRGGLGGGGGARRGGARRGVQEAIVGDNRQQQMEVGFFDIFKKCCTI